MFIRQFGVLFVFWILFVSLGIRNAAAQEEPESEYFENYYNEIDSNKDYSQERNAIRWDIQRWPQNTVPYQISENYNATEINTVQNALKVFDVNTCIRFVEYNKVRDLGKRYLYFEKRDAFCGTKVGYQPVNSERHNLYLSSLCLLLPGAIQHESLHVLGLYHEQSRPDRDSFIDIDWENIPAKNWHNFMKIPEIYASTYDIPYDFGSIMHYSNYAFAKDRNRPSMHVKKGKTNPYPKMGQLNSPSQGDFDKINKMYNCRIGNML